MKDSPMIAILAALKAKKKPEMEMESGDEMGDNEGMLTACEEILAAVKAEDAQALCDALCAFVDQCD